MKNYSSAVDVKKAIEEKLSRYFGCTTKEASTDQVYKAVAMTVKVGDKVIASKYAGTTVKLDGVEYTILSEDDIFAIVE